MAEGGASPASVSQKKKTCPKCCVAGKWKAIKQHFELMPGHKENQNQYQKAVECGQGAAAANNAQEGRAGNNDSNESGLVSWEWEAD